MMSPASYPYKALPRSAKGVHEIRLLTLKPGQGSDDIECEIRYTKLLPDHLQQNTQISESEEKSLEQCLN
jgi:hypothetical protein